MAALLFPSLLTTGSDPLTLTSPGYVDLVTATLGNAGDDSDGWPEDFAATAQLLTDAQPDFDAMGAIIVDLALDTLVLDTTWLDDLALNWAGFVALGDALLLDLAGGILAGIASPPALNLGTPP
jgi:hypothetical protein